MQENDYQQVQKAFEHRIKIDMKRTFLNIFYIMQGASLRLSTDSRLIWHHI